MGEDKRALDSPEPGREIEQTDAMRDAARRLAESWAVDHLRVIASWLREGDA